jgi:hypothetical protein
MTDVTGPEVTPGDDIPPAERAKLRFYFTSGSVIGALGVLALAGGEFRTGATSLVIGVAALVLGVRRGQGLVAGAGPAQTQPGAKPEAKTSAKATGKTSAKTKTGSKARARITTEAATFTAWYTVGLGLVLMGAGATTTVFARDAETKTAEILLFLAAGVLLWMGVTCLMAARVQIRKRQGTVPKRPRPAVSRPDVRGTRPPRRRPGAEG